MKETISHLNYGIYLKHLQTSKIITDSWKQTYMINFPLNLAAGYKALNLNHLVVVGR